MQRKQTLLYYLAVWFIVGLCSGCATGRGGTVPDTWGDATLVAEQQAEIEQLRRDVIDMGEYQREISERIDRITERLIQSVKCNWG